MFNDILLAVDGSEQALHAAKEAGELVRATQAKIHNEVIEGHTAEAVLDVANARKTDLIVMSSRGRGRLTGALFGGNSQKVVSQAPCPVLIVK